MSTVGIDVGGTKVLGLRVGAGGAVEAEARRPTPAGGDALVEAVISLVGELGGPGDGVGVGVPGLVDRQGTLRFAPNLPGVTDLAVGRAWSSRLGAPVRVGNDATFAAWAERVHGAARGADHALLVTLGTGIGGGIISDGGLLEGANGFAAEFGHMVVDPHGPPCPCGKRGCWERFASGSGLGRLAREAAHAGRVPDLVDRAGGDPEAVRGEHVTSAAAAGDPAAVAVMAEFAWWLALGLANLTNLLDPDCIVVGGGLVEAGETLLVPARLAFEGLVEGVAHRPEVPLVGAVLGERAGAVGAAVLARPAGPG